MLHGLCIDGRFFSNCTLYLIYCETKLKVTVEFLARALQNTNEEIILIGTTQCFDYIGALTSSLSDDLRHI